MIAVTGMPEWISSRMSCSTSAKRGGFQNIAVRDQPDKPVHFVHNGHVADPGEGHKFLDYLQGIHFPEGKNLPSHEVSHGDQRVIVHAFMIRFRQASVKGRIR